MRRTIGWTILSGLLAAPGLAQAPHPRWSVRAAGAAVGGMPMLSGPAVADTGAVAVGTMSWGTKARAANSPARVICFDGRTGKVRWRFNGATAEKGHVMAMGDARVSADGRLVLTTEVRGPLESEFSVVRTVALDGQGKLLWQRKKIGAPVLSPDGRIAVPQEAMETPGFDVRGGRDGKILWSARRELGGVGGVSFAPGGAFLATTGRYAMRDVREPDLDRHARHGLFTADGQPLWLAENLGEGSQPLYHRAALSRDGAMAAILGDGALPDSRRLLLIRRDGKVAGDFILSGPDRDTSWTSVALSPDGRSVFLAHQGGSTSLVRAYDTAGRFLWDRSIPGGEGRQGSAIVLLLPSGPLLLSDNGRQVAFLDGAGAVRRTWTLPSAGRMALSPNGRYLAVAGLDGRVASYNVPRGLTRAVPLTRAGSARDLKPVPATDAAWTWAQVKEALPGGWTFRYEAAAKRIVARGPQGRTLTLTPGTWHAEEDSERLVLPGAVTIVRGRMLVPTTLRERLRGVPPPWTWVPVRELFPSPAWSHRFDAKTGTYTAERNGGVYVRLSAGERTVGYEDGAWPGEVVHLLPAAPHIEDGRMMVPSTLARLLGREEQSLSNILTP